MPPSGANTSSLCTIGRHLFAVKLTVGASAQRKHLPGGDGLQSAVGEAKHKAAVVIETLTAADNLALRQAHPDGLTNAGSAREPIGAHSGKALAASPLLKPPQHGAAKRRK